MTTRLQQTAALAVGIMLANGFALGGSIWAKASKRVRPLHSDDTARKIGDMLTIVIKEHSVIENETKRDMSKESTRKASVSGNLNLLGALDHLTGRIFNLDDLSLDTSAKNDFKGDASYDTDRKVEDQITVTVADVLPNGNLVVVGTRDRQVSGDRQIMQISGVVRPSDITFDNTVQSDQIAEFKVVFKHVGRENTFTKPGWFGGIMNILNPF